MEKHKQIKYASRYPLQDGQGIRCTWRVQPGEIVDVRTRSGKVYQTRIKTILWGDVNDGSLICRTRGCKQRPWVSIPMEPDTHRFAEVLVTFHEPLDGIEDGTEPAKMIGVYRRKQDGLEVVVFTIGTIMHAVARSAVSHMIDAMCGRADEAATFDRVRDDALVEQVQRDLKP